MGDVDFFLGAAFTWLGHADNHLSVHITQTAITEFSAYYFGVNKMNPVVSITSYCSDMPIDYVLPLPQPP